MFLLRRHVFFRPLPISEKELFLEEHIGFRSVFFYKCSCGTSTVMTSTRRNHKLRYNHPGNNREETVNM